MQMCTGVMKDSGFRSQRPMMESVPGRIQDSFSSVIVKKKPYHLIKHDLSAIRPAEVHVISNWVM